MSVGSWISPPGTHFKHYVVNNVQHVAIWPGTNGIYFGQICGNLYEKIYKFDSEEKAKTGILKIWLEKKVRK